MAQERIRPQEYYPLEELQATHDRLHREVAERLVELGAVDRAIAQLKEPPGLVLEFDPERDL
jgi:hypothetical protein